MGVHPPLPATVPLAVLNRCSAANRLHRGGRQREPPAASHGVHCYSVTRYSGVSAIARTGL